MTALELANIALTRMNEPVLSALTDDTYVANLIRTFFKPVADESTLMEDWQFARKRAVLVEDEISDNLTDYTYMFDLPSDCLVPRELKGGGQYEIEDGKLYTDEEEPTLIYTRSLVAMEADDGEGGSGFDIPVLQTNTFPITFAQAIACRMGSQIGPKISDNFGLAQALAGEYMAMLELSRNYDGMLSPANDADSIELWTD